VSSRLPSLFALVAALLLPAFTPVLAADTPPEPAHPVRQSSPVKVANRTIIVLRGPIAGYTAEERATATMERIEAVLAQQPNPQITFQPAEDGLATRVLLGGSHAFLVTGIDIDPSAGESTKVVAREAGRRLEAAIAELRETQTPRFLGRAALWAALATLTYVLALRLFFLITRWSDGRLSLAAARRAGEVEIGGVKVIQPANVARFGHALFVACNWAVAMVLTAVWLAAVLRLFPFTRPWGENLGGHLLDIIRQFSVSTANALPGLFVVVLIFLLARFGDQITGAIFGRVERGGLALGWIDTDTAGPTRRIIRVGIWIFALAMAYPYLPGAQTEAFKGLSVLVGLMLSLGGAGVVGQAFNGLILMYSRTFRAGDYVRIGDTEGTISSVGMFVTRLRTGLGEEITLPNTGIMAGAIKNYSRAVAGTGYVVDTVVTIGYSTPWRQVHAMLEEAARRTPEIAKVPEPMVRQTALTDFYVEYRLIAYTPAHTPRARVEVLSDLHSNVLDVFNEHGVQIMSPHYMADAAAPQVVEKKDWYAAPAREPAGKER
jgi:small-conductance mechanosensitive channel